ncbi:M48 family metalloprotease [candidate division KSB3 bacterium]|uniref:M48 family metalloprotease n=1 Tax=candidate division KSB3 bacterium TaxID=2044937 RepID=A0A9D5Q5Z0_9BACT|nr:M48 family metalloprotease [candidate division KSB3 bacterium]MBD3325319.1 M48 family metalloprotease [candidate division KSB3 bacterium]
MLSLLLAMLWLLSACSTVPITGRSQLNLIPDSQLLSMSYQQYDEFLQSHQVSRNTRQAQMVQRVGRDLQRAVERYFRRQNSLEAVEGYAWEFHLIESDDVNAWCMPGGKVVVYSGIMPIAQDETGLAVIMGHEIAHAIAEHGNERMSQALLVELGGVALSKALEEKPQMTRSLWLQAYGLGAQIGAILPYSRLHELEADRMGLIFMAMAGYDPHAAVAFWERMAAQGGPKPPEFLSTHPADRNRIAKIQDIIPEAMQYYNP